MELKDGISEWKQSEITKMLIQKLHQERLDSMEAILNSDKIERSIGITIGITFILNLIQELEEGDISEYFRG